MNFLSVFFCKFSNLVPKKIRPGSTAVLSRLGEFTDKRLGTDETGLHLMTGDKVGCLHQRSSIMLLFEVPKDFQFLVEPGQRILFRKLYGLLPVGINLLNELQQCMM